MATNGDLNMAIDKPGVVGLVVELRVALNCRRHIPGFSVFGCRE